MRSGLIHLGVLAAACLLWSCGGHGHDSHGGDGEDHGQAEPQEHAHSGAADVHQAVGGLKLDDGHKWKADDHTRATLQKMASSFLGSEFAEGDELKKAGSDLHGLIDELIEGCTMTGPAHDQLHYFLQGYQPAVEQLSRSGSLDDAERVRQFLEMYDDYFE